MSKIRMRNAGFTIVELLIVIVVIAILAAMVIVAYNGMQARARAVAVESAVDAYRKGVMQYLTLNDNYPATNTTFCLGAVSNYGDGCFSGGNATSGTEAALKTVMPSLPQVDSSCKMMYGTSCRRNLTLFYQPSATLDGSPHSHYLVYFLDGAQPCTLGGNVGGSWEAYTSTPNASGYLERDGTTGVTMCAIAMPDPS